MKAMLILSLFIFIEAFGSLCCGVLIYVKRRTHGQDQELIGFRYHHRPHDDLKGNNVESSRRVLNNVSLLIASHKATLFMKLAVSINT